MDNTVTLKIELGISAQRIMQQVIMNDRLLEEEIEKGILAAFIELGNSDIFTNMVKEATKQAISDVVKNSVNEWNVKNLIANKLQEQIAINVEEYAMKIGQEIVNRLTS
jgi:ribosomal protein S3AE